MDVLQISLRSLSLRQCSAVYLHLCILGWHRNSLHHTLTLRAVTFYCIRHHAPINVIKQQGDPCQGQKEGAVTEAVMCWCGI